MTEFTTASGEVLTDVAIEILADEAERGYDFDRATRVTFGRPCPGAKRAWPRVEVRVGPELAETLRDRALKEHCSVTEVIRTVLREYVERAA